MLEGATVTLPYKELDELVKEVTELREKIKNIPSLMDTKEFEENPLIKCLDETFDILDKASKCTRANEKQFYIYQSMINYCKVLDIPTAELMEDISKGKEPK